MKHTIKPSNWQRKAFNVATVSFTALSVITAIYSWLSHYSVLRSDKLSANY
ncbi:hypothetical protein [Vibrio owensii]|uniref:hypothetical protein n=1 Tax=Vibrio owensii TaxID=696485 RepID=UPI0018F1B881|nr:hypothetical protein [Vibrio owensii]